MAGRLGWAFVDLDHLIEERTGYSVAALFDKGEAVFRAAEADALAATTTRARIVVATGGGTLVQPGAMDRAKAAGTVCYLRISPVTLASRLKGDASRPLLYGARGRPLYGAALQARINALLNERRSLYEQADLIVDAEDTPASVAEVLLAALSK
ncbi:MAG: shikimate kinase [Rhodothermaceae bacterium]|nr:shikimate kinase [Rhodothermaceae bacterium]